MNHDITHCIASDCPKKGTCFRYIAYLDAKRHNMEYVYITQPEEKPCKLYVKIQSDENIKTYIV